MAVGASYRKARQRRILEDADPSSNALSWRKPALESYEDRNRGDDFDLSLAVLPQQLPNAADRWPVAEFAVVPRAVVVVQPDR